MSNLNKQKLLENIIYSTMWLLMFAIPVLDSKMSAEESLLWRDILMSWITIIPFFLLFLLNNFVSVPLLFSVKKYWGYIIVTLLSILIVFTIYPRLIYMTGLQPGPRDRYDEKRIEMSEKRPGKPPVIWPQKPPADWDRQQRHMDPQRMRPPDMSPQFPYRPLLNPKSLDSLFTNILIAILLIGFNLAIKLIFKSLKDQQALKDLESHNLQFELEYLKGQINPHFFMNMLNNIHALVDIDSEQAKTTIIGFSKLMRYVLYDASQKTIGLDKELEFVKNYIKLMKIRYPEDVDISISIPENVPDFQIPPLLFVSFMENAFKHGISYRHKSFVAISMQIREDKIIFEISNSRWNNKSDLEEGGIGMVNTRKRLDLIYGKEYLLNIDQKEKEYKVLLILPLK